MLNFAQKIVLQNLAPLLVLPAALFAAGPVIDVDVSGPTKPLANFWNASGFSPADIVATKEMKAVLQDDRRLGAGGMGYMRPHYLLNLVEVRGMDTDRPAYNWTRLDEAIDAVTRGGMKLIFEIMGFPSDGSSQGASQYDKNFQEQLVHQKSYFDDLTQREQIVRWRTLVKAVALHLEARYGRQTVRTWLFESTNEPDTHSFWTYDAPTLLNYYDASSEGLNDADPSLRFGGPGTARDLSGMFTALIAHCESGRNFFTGKTGVRLDFISIHAKAQPAAMIAREVKIVNYLRAHAPGLANQPFVNDEADPVAGWARPYWWEQGSWYAAFVAQNIDLHQRLLREAAGVNLLLLSNDHSFLGDWNQRTTHALFRDQPNSDGFVIIRKPVLSVMELISRLGDRRLETTVPPELADHFGVIPTVTANSIAVLLYNKTPIEITPKPKPAPDVETALMADGTVNAQLRVRGHAGTSAWLTEYVLDESHGNPYRAWVEMGRPTALTAGQVAGLRALEHPARVESRAVSFPDHTLTLQVTAPSPSVTLILVGPKAD